jgi:hypothetical protein
LNSFRSRTETSGGYLWTHKMKLRAICRIPWLGQPLLASQGEPCSIELLTVRRGYNDLWRRPRVMETTEPVFECNAVVKYLFEHQAWRPIVASSKGQATARIIVAVEQTSQVKHIQNTQSIWTIMTSRVIMFSEIIVVYSENQTKDTITLWGRIAELLSVEADGICAYLPLKCKELRLQYCLRAKMR